jgi:hypothetical protein
MSDEIRVTDPETGGQKGSKLARFDLIPVEALLALAEHFGKGSLKYAPHNWMKGYVWSLSYAALQRHANAWWGGENTDKETGSSHMICVAWHALTLYTFEKLYPNKDDRPIRFLESLKKP